MPSTCRWCCECNLQTSDVHADVSVISSSSACHAAPTSFVTSKNASTAHFCEETSHQKREMRVHTLGRVRGSRRCHVAGCSRGGIGPLRIHSVCSLIKLHVKCCAVSVCRLKPCRECLARKVYGNLRRSVADGRRCGHGCSAALTRVHSAGGCRAARVVPARACSTSTSGRGRGGISCSGD
jgi:hypothetical protein